MSFDWAEFHSLADALCQDPQTPGPCEASLRSAISRAYYACYGCAMAFATGEQFARRRFGQDHSRLIGHFRGSQDPTRQMIAQYLDRLRTNRNAADYDDVMQGSLGGTARYCIKMANKVLRALASLSSGTP